MMPRRKRRVLILSIILVILLILLIVFLILYNTTDMFKSNDVLFNKYAKQLFDNTKHIFNQSNMSEMNEILSNNKLEADTSIKVKYDENAHNTLEMLTYDENELTLTPQEGKINFNVTINGRYLNKDLQDTITVNVVASKNGQEQIIDTLHLKSDGKAINYEKKLDGIDYDTVKVKLVPEELKLRTQNHSITIFR